MTRATRHADGFFPVTGPVSIAASFTASGDSLNKFDAALSTPVDAIHSLHRCSGNATYGIVGAAGCTRCRFIPVSIARIVASAADAASLGPDDGGGSNAPEPPRPACDPPPKPPPNGGPTSGGRQPEGPPGAPAKLFEAPMGGPTSGGRHPPFMGGPMSGSHPFCGGPGGIQPDGRAPGGGALALPAWTYLQPSPRVHRPFVKSRHTSFKAKLAGGGAYMAAFGGGIW